MLIFATLAFSALPFSAAPGVLVNDRGKSNDARELAGLRQQKYLAHPLRDVSEVAERKRGMAREFGLTLETRLREGLALWKARQNFSPEQYEVCAQELEQKLTHHLKNRILRDDEDQRSAVIARKASHAKNSRGAEAFSAFVSVIPTARKTHPASINYLWPDWKRERFKIVWELIGEKS